MIRVASKGQLITILVAIVIGSAAVLGSAAYVTATYSAAGQHSQSAAALTK